MVRCRIWKADTGSAWHRQPPAWHGMHVLCGPQLQAMAQVRMPALYLQFGQASWVPCVHKWFEEEGSWDRPVVHALHVCPYSADVPMHMPGTNSMLEQTPAWLMQEDAELCRMGAFGQTDLCMDACMPASQT